MLYYVCRWCHLKANEKQNETEPTEKLQAHLGYKVTGDKVHPKVGKHKVQEVKNHKVLEPHRETTNSPARPGPACAPPTDGKSFCAFFLSVRQPHATAFSFTTFSSNACDEDNICCSEWKERQQRHLSIVFLWAAIDRYVYSDISTIE